MKKIIALSILSAIVLACSRKTTPQEIVLSNTTHKPAVAQQDISQPDLATAGKNIYINRCGRCHALKNTAAFNVDEWKGILADMIPRAKLDSTQATQVTAYVLQHAKK